MGNGQPPPACDQCGRLAVYLYEGHPFCIDCNLKRVQAATLTHNMLVDAQNYMADAMEARLGMRGLVPRFARLEPPTIVQGRAVTLNNIHVENSVLGAINTGTVHRLDVAVTNAKAAGAGTVADEIARISEAILNDATLTAAQKNEAMEHLTFIATETAQPREARRRGPLRATVTALGEIVRTVPGLVTLWDRLYPYLEPLLTTPPPAGP